jgi:hypothetical protein
VGEGTRQRVPSVGGIAEAEARGDLAGQAAALEISDRTRVALELAAVVLRCFFEHLGQRRLTRLGLRRRAPLVVAALVVGHLQARLLRQVADRIAKTRAGMFGQKADRIARRAAAEAVVELLGRADGKAR